MKLLLRIGLIIVLLILATAVLNLNAGEPAVNPAGTWKVAPAPKTTFEPTLVLKLTGDTLTGTMTRNTGSKIEVLNIQDAKLQGSEISFSTHFYAQVIEKGVVQPPNTNFMSHWQFRGTITGDLIQGKIEKESSVAGHRTQTWEAKRVKP